MSALVKIGPGKNTPDEINVVIEIPSHSDPIKYEVDKETGALCVDRFLGTAMYYPCNYGYVPQTLSEDGDPVDVLVVAPFPLLIGCMIRCRPIGMLQMEDESGIDAKILAVPIDKLSTLYRKVETWEDLPPELPKSIQHFFEHYKDLEKGKWVKVKEWSGIDAAKKEIQASLARYKE
ncbi:MAG: inorganic diphosphatase [Pseudomonadota bacterium]